MKIVQKEEGKKGPSVDKSAFDYIRFKHCGIGRA